MARKGYYQDRTQLYKDMARKINDKKGHDCIRTWQEKDTTKKDTTV